MLTCPICFSTWLTQTYADYSSTSDVVMTNHRCRACGTEFTAEFTVSKRTPFAVEWTTTDQEQALASGWGIFNVDSRGVFEIQRHDELEFFPDDAAAVRAVQDAVLWSENSPYGQLARKALAFIAINKKD